MIHANMMRSRIRKAIVMRAAIIRALLYLSTDMLVISVCLNLALLLRFDFLLADEIRNTAFLWLPAYIIPPCTAMYINGVYSFNWRYFGLHECYLLCRALISCLLLVFAANTIVQEYHFAYALPRSTPFSAYILAGFFIIVFRVSRRLIIELSYPLPKCRKTNAYNRGWGHR